jgi:hypothetical protein
MVWSRVQPPAAAGPLSRSGQEMSPLDDACHHTCVGARRVPSRYAHRRFTPPVCEGPHALLGRCRAAVQPLAVPPTLRSGLRSARGGPPSTLSALNLWVKAFEFDASISSGELPVHPCLGLVSPLFPLLCCLFVTRLSHCDRRPDARRSARGRRRRYVPTGAAPRARSRVQRATPAVRNCLAPCAPARPGLPCP